jgi:hypothetical protein
MKIWHREQIELSKKEVEEVFIKKLEEIANGSYREKKDGVFIYYRQKWTGYGYKTTKIFPTNVEVAAIELLEHYRT